MSCMSSCGSSAWLAISRNFASDSWPWPRIALACVSSSCGRWRFGERPVALAADRQQQRMHAGRVDGVHADNARQHGGNHRPGQLVDELAEDRVFLRRPADDRERPDRAVAVIDVLDAQHREIVLQTVVAQVIAERPFGQQLVGDRPCRRCRSRCRRGSAGRPRGEACECAGRRAHRRTSARSFLPAAASRRPASSPAARRRKRSRGTACPRESPPRDARRSSGESDSAARPRGPARTGRRKAARGTCRGSNAASPGSRTSSVYTCGSVMNAPPSSGQLTCCGRCEIVVSFAVTSRAPDEPRQHRQRVRAARRRTAAAAASAAVGSIFSSTSRRTRSSVSRNMNRARSIVPNRLLTIGKRQPFTRVNNSAGPPAAHTRR